MGLAAITTFIYTPSAAAQFGPMRGRATVIENVTIEMMNGQVIENGMVIMRGDRVVAVGSGLEISDKATRIDGAGGWVTPGLIDVSGSIALVDRNGSSAIHKAIDGFDPFDSAVFREAVRHGVTAMYLPARGSSGINGVGAVVRLAPREGGGVGEVVVEDAALCIDFGSSGSAIERLGTFAALRDAFKNAKAYRESLETYEEDLEDYIEKIEKRAQEEEKAKAEKAKKSKGEKKPEGEKKTDGKPADPGAVDEFAAFGDPPTQDPRRRRRPPGRGGAPQPPPDSVKAPADDKKDDEIKKPVRPAPNHAAEVLLSAIDGELQVRAEAHRDEDILNALALAEEFGLDFVLEGATEAYRVADAIADADVPVVLSPVDQTYRHRGGVYRLASPAQCRILSKSGVKWVVGTGSGTEMEGRFVLQAAQRVLAGLADDSSVDAIQLVTRDAAEFLGVSEQMGRIGRGRVADIVVWSGDPAEADSRVVRTYVGGRLLYRAD